MDLEELTIVKVISIEKQNSVVIEEDKKVSIINESASKADDVINQNLPDKESHIIHLGYRDDVRISHDSLCLDIDDLVVIQEQANL
jgi:hypothetical protein